MKAASPALTALLASRNFAIMDLYALTLSNNAVFYYSGGDADVLYSGNIYSCGGVTGPYWGKDGNRSTLHQKLGTNVDQLFLEVLPGQGSIQGLTYAEARRTGLFNGAWLQYSRAYFSLTLTPQWPLVPVGVLPRFLGPVGAIDGGGSDMVMTVNSPMKILQQQIPRNLYQPGCVNCLGDTACGVNMTLYTFTGSVLSGSSAILILTALVEGNDYFDQGVLTFTSGVNAGYSRTVETWTETTGQMAMATPFPFAPSTGDSFTVSAGCDGSFGPQGCPKFSNQSNFRGFPYIPPPSTAS